ncbi:flavocytochrome c [Coleophoma cylindrospora]|uniref:Fumarate reductase n=1 Tax=Coleophoma cylindrospora TaxID=1849047 RepID=A0A3D8RN97_9HELO|nr:flavocytochrome c [Coleophoma cylindrospora]
MVMPTLPSYAATQVIVVGSGLAGLSAASQLASHKIPVRLLERSTKLGGNSIKASSGINGAPTKYQSLATPDAKFYEDTVKSAGPAFISSENSQRQKLVETLTSSSSSAIDWLVDEKGIDLCTVAQLGGHSLPRTHRGSGQLPPGAAIVTTLLKDLRTNPLVQVETSCIVTKIIQSQGQATGVEYTFGGEKRLLKGPVVFASGGFAGDAHGMLAKYRPDLADIPSTNEPRPGSQNLLIDVGAQPLDMNLVQVHPTSFVDPKDPSNPLKFLAAELLRGEGGLLLHSGKRFVNEMETRQHITDTIMRILPAKDTTSSLRQWDVTLVLDEGCYEAAKSHIDFYLWKGLMVKTTVGDLKDSESAIISIQDYSDMAAGRAEDPYGRKAFAHWTLGQVTLESVVYVGRITPAIHFTMGGVMFNERSEVLDGNRQPIKGLWAAGEVTGGLHGENRLGGSSLLECVVFGRIAGDQASAFYKKL